MKRKVNTFVTMQPKSNPPNFPTSTSSAQVFLASRFLSAEEDLASLIREALSFMKSSDWLKPSDLLIFSLKTCRGVIEAWYHYNTPHRSLYGIIQSYILSFLDFNSLTITVSHNEIRKPYLLLGERSHL